MTAMTALVAIGVNAPETPRFDDVMANINELLRTLAEALLYEAMNARPRMPASPWALTRTCSASSRRRFPAPRDRGLWCIWSATCVLVRIRRERALLGLVMRGVFAESDPALFREMYHLAIHEIGAVNAVDASFRRRPRLTRWPIWISYCPTIAYLTRTMCRGAPTANSRRGAAWCRCSP